MKSNIPVDLVQIQAYIRWEKAGKPNYSPEQQLVSLEFACTCAWIYCDALSTCFGSGYECVSYSCIKNETWIFMIHC